jgi:hypothetical protein
MISRFQGKCADQPENHYRAAKAVPGKKRKPEELDASATRASQSICRSVLAGFKTCFPRTKARCGEVVRGWHNSGFFRQQ